MSIIIIFDTNANPSSCVSHLWLKCWGRNYWGKWTQIKCKFTTDYKWLPSLCSDRGASWFPHHFPVFLPGCCWDTDGCFWACSRDAALPLACLCSPSCMTFITWFEYMQMLQWCPVKGNTPPHHLSRLPSFSPLFSFLSLFLTAASSAVWEPATEGQICFVTWIYLKE